MLNKIRYLILDIFFTIVVLSAGPLFAQDQVDIKQVLADKYEERAGYMIDSSEQQSIHNKGWSPTYGEITPEGASILIKELKLTNKDRFYDLGCGVGKLVFQIFLEGGVQKSVGIELSPSRLQYAKKVHADIKHTIPADNRILAFIEQNMLEADLSDATALYVASTCFSNDVMTKLAQKLSSLPAGTRLVTLTELPNLYNFRLDKKVTIPMTWSPNTTAYFYVLDPKKRS